MAGPHWHTVLQPPGAKSFLRSASLVPSAGLKVPDCPGVCFDVPLLPLKPGFQNLSEREQRTILPNLSLIQ